MNCLLLAKIGPLNCLLRFFASRFLLRDCLCWIIACNEHGARDLTVFSRQRGTEEERDGRTFFIPFSVCQGPPSLRISARKSSRSRNVETALKPLATL